MEGTMAEIRLFSGNFAPRNWAFCNGQLIPIAQNTALFSLLGTIYGGDGRTTFALPDLRGRASISPGQGPGLPYYNEGEVLGSPTTTLIAPNMPMHNHLIAANNAAGTSNSPENAFMGTGPVDRSTGQPVNTRYATTPNTTMNVNSTSVVGGNASFNNMQPSLAVYYIICMYGIFPSRG